MTNRAVDKCENCGSELRTCGKCGWSKVYEEDVSTLKRELEEQEEISHNFHKLSNDYLAQLERSNDQLFEISMKLRRLKDDNAKMRECLEEISRLAYMAKDRDHARECLSKLGSGSDA